MNEFLTIENDGQNIKSTNYFESGYAKRGLFYLSWNAGAARLLVPKQQAQMIPEVSNSAYVVITRGNWQGRDALELMFEDHSDEPFSLKLSIEQTDRLIPDRQQGSGFVVTLHDQQGQQLKFQGKYRTAKTLPCLQAWVEQ